jgi:transketolase
MDIQNKDLRRLIVEMVYRGNDGHIPSAFSILEIITTLYANFLRFKPNQPFWAERDLFVLSKGHGCLAQYVNLFKHGFISAADLEQFCTHEGILGEHPDRTKVPGAEANTGSLGHGLSFAIGAALGYKISKRGNRVIVLIGDGECHEGTVWEAAHVACNHSLGNLCVIVDWNKSASQLLPIDAMTAKWDAFGFNTVEIDGHNSEQISSTLNKINFETTNRPTAIIANTVKGYGVPMLQGHGQWHHKIPNKTEFDEIMEYLK